MELAISRCCEVMSGGAGKAAMRIVASSSSTESARGPELALFSRANGSPVKAVKALRMARQEWQMTSRRSSGARAVASGKDALLAEPGEELPGAEMELHHAEEQELDAAALVRELQEVYASGRTRSVEWREAQLKGMARMMLEREDEIGAALRQDLNKPMYEAYVGEISVVHSGAEEAAKNVRKWMQRETVPTTITSYPSSAEVIPEPLGVALILSAWNFPVLLSLVPVVGAIAGGNVVVLKPSELAPATSALLAKLFPLYLDPTAIRVVEGGIPETTCLLEQRWDKIFFTGSTRVGKIILAAAAKYITPVTLELGGKCPVIVDSKVDIEVVGTRLAWGKWASNNGQACIAPDYLLVEESVVPELLEQIKQSLEKFYGEDPSTSSDISRIVNPYHYHRLSALLDDKATAETIVHGGTRNESKLYISPTIVMDPPLDSPVMQEEIFGPILPIITVKDVTEAIRFVNSRPKPLALYLFTSDKAVQERVLAETSSGGVTVNDSILHFTVPGLPFGGVGDSGYGAYRGKYSFDTFTHKKAVLHRGLWLESDFRCPPYTDQGKQLVKALLLKDIPGLFRAIFSLK